LAALAFKGGTGKKEEGKEGGSCRSVLKKISDLLKIQQSLSLSLFRAVYAFPLWVFGAFPF
jgi:hypothetical protein